MIPTTMKNNTEINFYHNVTHKTEQNSKKALTTRVLAHRQSLNINTRNTRAKVTEHNSRTINDNTERKIFHRIYDQVRHESFSTSLARDKGNVLFLMVTVKLMGGILSVPVSDITLHH